MPLMSKSRLLQQQLEKAGLNHLARAVIKGRPIQFICCPQGQMELDQPVIFSPMRLKTPGMNLVGLENCFSFTV